MDISFFFFTSYTWYFFLKLLNPFMYVAPIRFFSLRWPLFIRDYTNNLCYRGVSQRGGCEPVCCSDHAEGSCP